MVPSVAVPHSRNAQDILVASHAAGVRSAEEFDRSMLHGALLPCSRVPAAACCVCSQQRMHSPKCDVQALTITASNLGTLVEIAQAYLPASPYASLIDVPHKASMACAFAVVRLCYSWHSLLRV